MTLFLPVEYLSYGITANADRYYEYLNKLPRAIQNKHRGLLSSGIIFLQNNATSYTAIQTKALLQKSGWNVLLHPPHSPNFTLGNITLFLHLKKFFGDEGFCNNAAVTESVSNWFQAQAANFYDSGISKL